MGQGPKPKGKYVEGQEPWTMLGIKYDAWYRRTRMDNEMGEQARDALRRARQIAGKLVEEPAPAPAEPAGAVEGTAAPAEPEPTEVPVVAVAAAQISPAPVVAPAIPAANHSPAASLSVTSEPPPAVAGATVFVSFRCPVTVHDRMREMVHKRRVKLQGIVAAAVEAYLSQNGF